MGEKGKKSTKTGLAKVLQIMMSSVANCDEQLCSSYFITDMSNLSIFLGKIFLPHTFFQNQLDLTPLEPSGT